VETDKLISKTSIYKVHSQQQRLDGLICNAGVLLNERTLTREKIEVTFATHLLFGTYLLTSLALSYLENTPNSRVIVVSSGGTAYP
jgi:dehydrogenase/reductase SDR family protein 12